MTEMRLEEACDKLAEGSRTELIKLLGTFDIEEKLGPEEDCSTLAARILAKIHDSNPYITVIQNDPFTFKSEDIYVSPLSIECDPSFEDVLEDLQKHSQTLTKNLRLLEKYREHSYLDKPIHCYGMIDAVRLAEQFARNNKIQLPSYILTEIYSDIDFKYVDEALRGKYQLFAIYEISGIAGKGYLYKNNDLFPPLSQRTPSIPPFMVYCHKGHNYVHRITSTNPKFVYLSLIDSPYYQHLHKEQNDDAPLRLQWEFPEESLAMSIKQGNEYYCVDKRIEATTVKHRFIVGDIELKRLVSKVSSSKTIKHIAISSPAIIIDLDSFKAIGYIRQDSDIPFLLDSHHFPIRLTELYMNESEATEYTRYKKAVDRINRSLASSFERCVGDSSSIPGEYYHPTLEERRLFVSCQIERILSKGFRLKDGSSETGICLSPCGFSLKPYLDVLVNNKIIEPVKTDAGKATGRYQLRKKTQMISIVLFSFIMNTYIANEYEESLTSAERHEWDYSYHENLWTTYLRNTNIEGKYRWRECEKKTITYKFEEDENGELTITETKAFRVSYFARLLSLDENSIRTLKPAITNPDKVNPDKENGNASLREIIRFIKKVDIERKNIK